MMTIATILYLLGGLNAFTACEYDVLPISVSIFMAVVWPITTIILIVGLIITAVKEVF